MSFIDIQRSIKLNPMGIKRFVKLYALILIGLDIISPVAVAQPYFPKYQEYWPMADPEEEGLSATALENAESKMQVDDGSSFNSIDMIVIRNGKDVWHIGDPYTMYQKPWKQKDWASCGRSLMTTMYGMVWQEHQLGVEELSQPAVQSFNSFVARELDKDILVKHLLSYTACADPPGSGWQYACHYFTMYRILRDIDARALPID